ncbi:hypothetical protein CIPAW_16G092700 [Carya illinoinensis]|uniref:Uncharacterized protein n=1 Tax=Carya illinoinensis TaxID=32201 RepID=A0A8T1N8M7_CARIL|nr:hypothetical protein CIPAW_16G092700 [Carya illinoinensis]
MEEEYIEKAFHFTNIYSILITLKCSLLHYSLVHAWLNKRSSTTREFVKDSK